MEKNKKGRIAKVEIKSGPVKEIWTASTGGWSPETAKTVTVFAEGESLTLFLVLHACTKGLKWQLFAECGSCVGETEHTTNEEQHFECMTDFIVEEVADIFRMGPLPIIREHFGNVPTEVILKLGPRPETPPSKENGHPSHVFQTQRSL